MSHLAGPGADGATVFRFVTAMAFTVFAALAMPGTIWEGKPASVALKGILDAVLYALTMGAVFRFLWPHA